MKKILVTGATGFIGSSLVDALVKNGNEVIPVGRSIKKYNSEFIKKNLINIDLIRDDLQDLENIDCACLLASQQPTKDDNWNSYYNINSKQVFHFINKDIKQLIYVSTTSVNMKNSAPNPLNHYGLSKALAERLILINSSNFEQSTILRFPSVIGFNHRGGILHDFKKWIEKNEQLKLFDMGEKYRNILHVDEAVSSIVATINSRRQLNKYEEIEIGSKDSLKLLEVVELMLDLMGKKLEINLSQNTSKAIDVIIDNSKAIKKLSYQPQTIKYNIKKYLKSFGYEV